MSYGDRPRLASGGFAVIVITALMLIGSGCSTELDGVPSALVSGSPAEKKDEPADPIDFGSKSLWSKESLDDVGPSLSGFDRTRVIGDRIAYVQHDENYDGHLTVADAETGKTQWELTQGEKIPGSDGLLADHMRVSPLGNAANAETLIVLYLDPSNLTDGSAGEELGIAAISIKDGRLRWSVPVATGAKYEHNLFVEAVSSEYVATSLSVVDDDTHTDDLVLVDVKQRKVAWQKDDFSAAAIVGNTIVAEKFDPKAKTWDPVTVMGLKASNGSERWKLGHDPEVLDVTADAVIASTSGAVAIVDPHSGDTRAKLRIAATTCHFDGESTLACQAQDSETGEPTSAISLVKLSDDSATSTHVPRSDDVTLAGVYRGRIFAEGPYRDEHPYRLLDVDGNVIDEQSPGRLIDISENFAVFTYSDDYDSETMKVHKVKL